MKQQLKTAMILLVVIFTMVAVYYIYDTVRPLSFNEKLADIITIEDSRRQTDQLTAYTHDDLPKIRARAAIAIGRIGEARAAPILYKMVNDENLEVARSAAFAIGLTDSRQFAARLLDIAWDLPTSVMVETIKSAGRLADSSMIDFHQALSSFMTHPAPEVLEACCFAYLSAGAKVRATDLIDLITPQQSDEVKAAALYVLSRWRSEAASSVFARMVTLSDPWIRSLAARGMSVGDSTKLFGPLSMALNDKDNRVVAEAIRAMAARKEKQAAIDHLAPVLNQATDENLIVLLIESMRELESDRSVERVIELVSQEEPADNIVAASLTYLSQIQKGRAMSFVDSVLYHPQIDRVRAAGMKAYQNIGGSGVLARLGTGLADIDPMVRAVSFEALLEIDKGNRDYYIRQAVGDGDMVLGSKAVDKIASDTLTEFLPLLFDLISMKEDADLDIRRSVITALKSFVKPTDNDSLIMRILIAGILDPNMIVRKEAAIIYDEVIGENRYDMVPPARKLLTRGEIARALGKYRSHPQAVIFTNRGLIRIELFVETAPLTALTFMRLAHEGFYDGLSFHRVVPDFVIQGGDPRGDGWGGPPFQIRCEYSPLTYERGTVGIATSGKDTGGSQFFITHSPQPRLDAHYTIFGKVVEGMEVVDQIVVGDVIENILFEEGNQ